MYNERRLREPGQEIARRRGGQLFCGLILISLIFLISLTSSAMAAESWSALAWEKTWGDSANERGLSSAQTSDGGFIVTGEVEEQKQSSGIGPDMLLVRFDGSGGEIWRKRIRIEKNSRCASVRQTADGGFIVAGTTTNYFYDDKQVCLVKTDASGQVMWKKSYGAGGDDSGVCVRQTGDGGYIIAADSIRADTGDSDIMLIKTGAAGEKQWVKFLGGRQDEYAASLRQADDGGFVIAGRVFSSNNRGFDICLLKTGPGGDLEWQRTFGGNGWEVAYDVEQTPDRGYVVAGQTYSSGARGADAYLVKTDSRGGLEWEKTYGGRDLDVGRSVQPASDGGYTLAGWSNSFGEGKMSFYLVKAGPSGDVEKEYTVEGSNYDSEFYIGQASDGGYIVAGWKAEALRNGQVRNDGLQLYLVRLTAIPGPALSGNRQYN